MSAIQTVKTGHNTQQESRWKIVASVKSILKPEQSGHGHFYQYGKNCQHNGSDNMQPTGNSPILMMKKPLDKRIQIVTLEETEPAECKGCKKGSANPTDAFVT